jgi:apolipoprotein N-acyltransferase
MAALVGLREVLLALPGWGRAGAAFLAGLASVLALAPFFAGPVLFVSLPVLVWLIDGAAAPSARGRELWRAAVAGWWFGFGYFLAGLFWIGEAFLVESEKFGWALPFAVTLMPAGLALFWAAAVAGARAFWTDGLSRVLILAVALAGAEWLRGHILTGFPWNVLGYALTWPLVLMQSAAVLGIYGLTLWTVAIFSAPLVALCEPPARASAVQPDLKGLLTAVVLLAALTAHGALRLSQPPTAMHNDVRVRIVQPSVPQREKWQPEKQRSIFADHLALTLQDESGQRDGLAGITHVIWPEAAMPFLPLEHPEVLAALGQLLPEGTLLLSGALRREGIAKAGGEPNTRPGRAYNSLMVFGDDGKPIGVYDKIHLVPFGEFLPFQATLETMGLEQLTRLRGGFSAGPSPRPLLSGGSLPQIGPLICYEAIFPGDIVRGAERPDVLVNVTNDGWFGDTAGPHQHFHQARVRAVEEGLPLLRAANNGISAVVDPYGRVLKSLRLNERGVIDATVPEARPPTPYVRLGDWIFACNAMLFAALAGLLRRGSIG